MDAARLLVIDDDVELCRLLQRFMAGRGFHIDIAANGRQGMPLALSGQYALIVLDVMMPDITGFEVLRRIRAESRTPVLMLTAKGDTRDRVLGLELGADDYLPQALRSGRTRRPNPCHSAARRAPPGKRDRIGRCSVDPGARRCYAMANRSR